MMSKLLDAIIELRADINKRMGSYIRTGPNEGQKAFLQCQFKSLMVIDQIEKLYKAEFLGEKSIVVDKDNSSTDFMDVKIRGLVEKNIRHILEGEWSAATPPLIDKMNLSIESFRNSLYDFERTVEELVEDKVNDKLDSMTVSLT